MESQHQEEVASQQQALGNESTATSDKPAVVAAAPEEDRQPHDDAVMNSSSQEAVTVQEDENEGNQNIVDGDEDESDYEYESDTDGVHHNFEGFLETSWKEHSATSASSPNIIEETTVTNQPSSSAEASQAEDLAEGNATGNTISSTSTVAAAAQSQKQGWKEPSKEAVTMSLRAEKETSGGKRRLAQDLYRIMSQDTEEAGFSLEPSNQDSMEKWTIKLFQFDPDSNLAKDMLVLNVPHVQLEMSFPEQYPFAPPFVRVTQPRFKKQTGFVMNGALCMELLTSEGWNPINDIESVIVSIRSLLVVGDGRLEAATKLSEEKYQARLTSASQKSQEDVKESSSASQPSSKRQRANTNGDKIVAGGSYSVAEAQSAYAHLSEYHKKKGWDSSGWWARKG